MPPTPPVGPTPGAPHEITRLLEAWSDGDDQAFDAVIEVTYGELRRIAHHQLQGERRDHTLSTEALVHEAYLRLVDRSGDGWRNRAQFYAVASRAMRRVLVDYARRRKAEKRGGARVRVSWSGGFAVTEGDLDELLTIDDALTSLGARDARLRQVVECRFFGGMTVQQTAEALEVSKRSVERDWTRARTYLYRALGAGPTPPHPEPEAGPAGVPPA